MTNDINVKDFVAKTIKEIKDGLPEGFSIAENINFELSVTTKQEAKGKVGIAVASIDGNTKVENLQKIKFSISDDKAQLKKMTQAKDMIYEFFQGIAVLDTTATEQIVNNNKKTTKQLPKSKE